MDFNEVLSMIRILDNGKSSIDSALDDDIRDAYKAAWEIELPSLQSDVSSGKVDEGIARYFTEILFPSEILTAEEESVYLSIDGKLSRENQKKIPLLRSYLPMIPLIAKQFEGRGLNYLDLLQSGTDGILYSIEHADHKKDMPFILFTARNIYHYLKELIDNRDLMLDREAVKKAVDGIQSILYHKTMRCRVELDLSQADETERQRLSDYLLGRNLSDTVLFSNQLFQQEFSIDYEDNRLAKMDSVYLQMIKAFLSEIGQLSSNISGKITCNYEPYRGNLEKGYDDKGGFWDFILKDGKVYESEVPYI